MRVIFISAAIVFLAGCAGVPHFSAGQSAHLLKTVVRKPVRYAYLLYLPEEYPRTNRKYPLILFLHGSGERGTDLEKVKTHGLPAFLDAEPNFPFIVASPQCPDHEYFDNDALIALLNEVEKQYRVDKSRVYLTGLSMGGWGTWSLACMHPERFAAIAPVSAWGLSDLVQNLRGIPVWAFHGAKDAAVPLSQEQEMVDELRKIGGNVRLTVYPDLEHNIWKQVYETEDLYKWFLQHQRAASAE